MAAADDVLELRDPGVAKAKPVWGGGGRGGEARRRREGRDKRDNDGQSNSQF